MAFTGTAATRRVAGSLVRITGLSLAAAASGVIGLDGSGAELELPAGLSWAPYAGPDGDDNLVDLEESVQVSIVAVDDAGSAANDLRVVKANGGDPAAFTVTITNDGAGVSDELEIYLRYGAG